MPIIIDDFPQGSDQWFQARLGNPGASNASKIMTNNGKRSKQADDYLLQLAGEFVSGKHEDMYQSYAMQKGLERESEARMVFAMEHEIEIRQVALVYKNEQKICHVSPDGLIGENSGLEIKCPMLKTHVKYLINKKLPSEYFSQIQMSLYVCEREYWEFLSYYQNLPSLNIRLERDEKYIARLEEELERFCFELVAMIKRLKEIEGN